MCCIPRTEKKLIRWLKANGFVLVRQHHHCVYEDVVTGRKLTIPKTCSDRRGILNRIRDIKKLLTARENYLSSLSS